MARDVPYPNFNFTISFDPALEDDPQGGFSDMSGLMTELTVSEYRNGNDPENHVRKIQGVHKIGDVTLKRGLIDSISMWKWMEDARVNGPDAKKTVTIKMRDETGQNDVQTWTLLRVLPLKWTGPTLAGKGGGDVAMEELVLSCEGLVYGVPGAA
jgi:phage tail-like protein